MSDAPPSSPEPSAAPPAFPPAPTPPPYRPARRRGWPLPVVLLGTAAVVAAGLLAWVNLPLGGPGPTPSPTAPGEVPGAPSIVAEGRAIPVRALELSVGVPGVVADVRVAEGATVRAGDELLRLDTTVAEAELASATAALDAARARAAGAEAGVVQAREGETAAAAAVDQANAARNAAIAARDALPSGTPSAVRRQATAEIERATAARAAAQAQLRSARAAITAAEQAFAAGTADVARAEAGVTVAGEALAQGAIVAPFAGTVVSVEASAGQRVAAGVPLVRIADLGGWTFETTDLSEASIARIAAGATAVVTVDGLPDDAIEAVVTRVGAFGAPRQGDVVFRVVAEPAGDVPDGLRWNMTVTIEIATGE